MKYFLGFLAAVGLIVLVFVLVFRAFTGGEKEPVKPVTQLSSYADTATEVRLTIDGPVSADQDHDRVRITIGRGGNTIEIMQGYQGALVKSQSFSSNTEAYFQFLRSLQLLGYTTGDPSPALADERGQCPLRDRYIYEVVGTSGTIQRYWSTACGVGNFKGKGATIRELFRRQIPGYNKLVTGLHI